jgi:hypothetical protein
MKTIAITVIAAGLLAATPAIAGHEGHAPDAKEVAGSRDANACPPGGQDLFDYMMFNLEVQMEAIRDTDDPEERRRLLRNHMQTVGEALDLLDDRGAAPRSGPENGKGGMMRGSSMHRRLEQRVDRLQKLIEQIIEHEQAEGEGNRG